MSQFGGCLSPHKKKDPRPYPESPDQNLFRTSFPELVLPGKALGTLSTKATHLKCVKITVDRCCSMAPMIYLSIHWDVLVDVEVPDAITGRSIRGNTFFK